jgi:protein tyrosine phosphatase
MILKENTSLIINLTKTKEHGKTKCDKYWPSEVGKSISFHENEQLYELILISSESLMTNLIKRKLKFVNKTLNKEVRDIVQLNYLSWPDHGAPEQSDY